MSGNLLIAVAGATGNQGGAVTRALLRRGHRVRAMLRNVKAASAQALEEIGAELVQASFDDRASLTKAAADVDGVFMVTTPAGGIENEIEQGFAQVDAYADANIGHIVFSSVGSADRKTGIPHFESKFRIEQQLAALGLPYTVSAPAYFMENLLFPDTLKEIASGSLAIAMPPTRALQMQSVGNIGEFAASLFERGIEVVGKRFDIAADELPGSKMAESLSRASGKPVAFKELPPNMFRPAMEDLALMFEWFDRVGYNADVQLLRSDFADVPWTRFEDWAKGQSWN
jgi:uncharacterized protein YbjT (DUF2867 family)